MTRIDNAFVRSHFHVDYVEDLGNGWGAIRDMVWVARHILANPDKFPKADFAYLERQDIEGTCFLLKAPIQYIV